MSGSFDWTVSRDRWRKEAKRYHQLWVDTEAQLEKERRCRERWQRLYEKKHERYLEALSGYISEPSWFCDKTPALSIKESEVFGAQDDG